MKTMVPAIKASTNHSRSSPVPSNDRHAQETERSPRTRQPMALSTKNLVESDEYEWARPLSMPGLLTDAVQTREDVTAVPPPQRHATELIVETEDGDAASAAQLPGRLACDSEWSTFPMHRGEIRNELADEDEYTELAMNQLPGQLVHPRGMLEKADESGTGRGLCATCLYRDVCDFPRPAGGIWQCEEYA